MSELVLRTGENNPFENKPYTQQISQPITVSRNGTNYTQITYSIGVSPLSQIIKFIKALAITILTAGFGLLSNDIRTLWSEGLGTRKITTVLKPEPILPPSPVPTTAEEWQTLHSESASERQQRLDRLLSSVEDNPFSLCALAHLSMIGQDGQAWNKYKSALDQNENSVFNYVRQLDSFAGNFSPEINAKVLEIKEMLLNLCDTYEMRTKGINFPNDLLATMPNMMPSTADEWIALHSKSGLEQQDRLNKLVRRGNGDASTHCMFGHLAMIEKEVEDWYGDTLGGDASGSYKAALNHDADVVFNYVRQLESFAPSFTPEMNAKVLEIKEVLRNLCDTDEMRTRGINFPNDLLRAMPQPKIMPATAEEWIALHSESGFEQQERLSQLVKYSGNDGATLFCMFGHIAMIEQMVFGDGIILSENPLDSYKTALKVDADVVFNYVRQLDSFAASFSPEMNAKVLEIKELLRNLCGTEEMQTRGINFPDDLF